MLAKLISWATDPIIVFLLGVYVLIWQTGAGEYFKGLVFLAAPTILVGAATVWGYLSLRTSKFDFPQASRTPIIWAAVIGFGLNTIIFGSQILPDPFWFTLSMLFVMLFISLYLVNYYFDKASIHTAMLCFWMFVLINQLGNAWVVLLVVLVFTMWSRLYLRKHTLPEIIWGLCIGGVLGILAWSGL